MGKFVVTGLHSSGKSAFIRSFASDEDARILEVISQLQRSTRFIAEYNFKQNADLHMEITFKSKEDVADEVIENIRRNVFDEKDNQYINGAKDAKDRDKRENQILLANIPERIFSEGITTPFEGIELLKWICKNGKSAFIKLDEYIWFYFKDPDPDINDFAGEIFLKEGHSVDISLSKIRDFIGKVYEKSLEKNKGHNKYKIELHKNSQLIWDSNLVNERSENIIENVKMLFCVPKSIRGDKIPYFSGIVKEVKVELSLHEKFFDENGSVRYDFMRGTKYQPVNFSLLDSFGLDHGSGKLKGNDLQGLIVNSYRQIISQPGIDGVFLLGTLSNDIVDSQDDEQENIIPHIVNYNLSENPGLNVILIFNHADSDDDYSSPDGRIEIIVDLKKIYKEKIEQHKEILQLKNRFQEDYIRHSIDSFVDSICLYAAVEDKNKDAAQISAMNTETYENIDRICRSFSRFGIEWNDELNEDALKETEDFIGCLYEYLSSSIKLIAAKKKLKDLKDDEEYRGIGNYYRNLIRWNTAKALAERWNDEDYRSYNYTGRAFYISNYSVENQEDFDIDQHPDEVFEKHMMALYNYKCDDNNRNYPLGKDCKLITKGNQFIFIQKCMYDAIKAFRYGPVSEKEKSMEWFISENIRKLLGEEYNKDQIEGLGINEKKKIEANNVEKFEEEFKQIFREIFREKVIENYNSFYLCAVDDEIRRKLLEILKDSMRENDDEYTKFENANIRQLLDVIIKDVDPQLVINIDFEEPLNKRLMELIL